MITRRVRFPIRHKTVPEIPTSAEHPTDPIVQHELGGWSIWHDAERFPSHAFARAAWLSRNTRHRESICDA